MTKRLKYVNIVVTLSLFPLLAIAGRDYMALRAAPKRGVAARLTAPAAATAPSIMRYATVVETGIFPTNMKKLTPLEMMNAAGPASDGDASIDGIKLIGAFAGPRSFAIFTRESGAEESVFKPGDQVFGAGELKEVLKDRAIIASGRGEITFALEPEPPEDGTTETPGPAPAMSAASGSGMRLSKKVGDNEWVIDQGAVQNSLDNISSVLTDARLTPRTNNGAIDGFVLTEIKPRGIFDAMGLEEGDVLTRINGYEIDSPEKAVQVLSGLKGQTDMALDIIRGGRKTSFRYRIR